MRANRKSNPILMDYFKREIEPQLPHTLWDFDQKIEPLGLPPRKYVLYGSFSEGSPTLRSDVDIGVVFEPRLPETRTFYEQLKEKGTLAKIHGARIELTAFDQVDIDELKKQNPNIREIIIEPLHHDPEKLG